MSPGDEYNGWMKWVAKNQQVGRGDQPTSRSDSEAVKPA